LRVMEKTENSACEEDVAIGEAIYRSRAFSAHDGQGAFLYSVHILEDVTERRHAELALHDSELRFRRMDQMIDEVLWMASPDAQSILYISHAFEKLWGRPCADLYAQPHLWIEMIHPDDAPRVQQALDALVQGVAYNIDFRILHPDGAERWINDRGYALRDGPGQVILISGISLDITERKRLETVLRESEARFHALVDAAGDLIFTLNADGEVGYVNEMAARALDAAPEQVVGKRLRDLFPPETFEQQWRSLQKVFETGKPLYVEAPTRFPHSEVWQGTWLTPLSDASGSVVSVLGASRDITERKRGEETLRASEERYRTMIESSNDMIWTVSPDRRITFANQQAAEGIGYAIDDWLGKPFDPLVVEEDLPMALEIHDKLMRGEKGHYEVRGKKADGGVLILSVNASPIFKDGKVIGTISFGSDITERKQAEQKLRATLAEKEVLMREIHHRVKNNLQMMSALLELQSGYVKDEQALGYFKDSQQRIQSMAIIHEQLYHNESMSSIDFAAYLHSLIDNLCGQYGERCSQVNIRIDAQACTLPVDTAIPCGLVASELVSNAFKHAFPEGRAGELRISLQCVSGKVVLEVADNGVGLPAELDIHHSKSFGMQLVTLMVEEQLHGKLSVESNGHGTHVVCETGGAK